MRHRTLGPLLASALAIGAASCSLFGGRPEPNLLIVAVDSLRFDAISLSLGAARTPNVQRLAAEGVAFPWCFSPSPDALGGAGALLASRPPVTSGIAAARRLDPEASTLAEELADDGYRTVAVVSHPELGDPHADLQRGFSVFRTTSTAPNAEPAVAIAPRALPGRATDVNAALFPYLARPEGEAPWFALAQYSEPAEPRESFGRDDAAATVTWRGRELDVVPISDVIAWETELDVPPGRHELVLASDAPFFAWDVACDLAISAVGDASASPEARTRRAFAIENREDRTVRAFLSMRLHDAPTLAQARRRYKLEVEEIDRAFGELCDELRRLGQYDDTLIVLTATRGAGLGEHRDTPDPENLHDELVRVPLVIKPARDERAKARLEARLYTLLRLQDVGPTALELLDAGSLRGAEGVSLFDAVERVLVAEAHPEGAPAPTLAMRDERYKLVYRANEDRFALYDLHADTLELDNLYDHRGHLRSSWQQRLRTMAELSPEAMRLRTGKGSDAPAEPDDGGRAGTRTLPMRARIDGRAGGSGR